MLEFSKSSSFFQEFEQEFPEMVLNIEMLFENKLAVDTAFHQPKQFILAYNNLLGSLVFFRNTMATLGSFPLKKAVDDFVDAHAEEYAILNRLRNLSAHQRLIVPDEAFSVGLYRIRSGMEYIQKIGLGQLEHPLKPSREFSMQNTQDVFHQLTLFHSLTMIDLEHSALGECLGITRRWYYDVDYKVNERKSREIVDIYDTIATFSTKLLDYVCQAYSRLRALKPPKGLYVQLPRYNYINTLLEVDIYPNLFGKWWQSSLRPSNFGRLIEYETARKVQNQLNMYEDEYARLSATFDDYVARADRFSAVDLSITKDDREFDEFLGFVILQHWHLSKIISPLSIIQKKLDLGLLMELYRLARSLFSPEPGLSKAASEKRLGQQLTKIGKLLKKIKLEVLRVKSESDKGTEAS